MSDVYRHIYLDRFGQVQYHRVSLKCWQMHVRGTVRPDGELLIAWRRHEDDRVVIDGPAGPQTLPRPCMGFFAFAFTPDGLVAVQHDQSGRLTLYDEIGSIKGELPAPYAAEGIAEIRADDVVVMMTDPSRTRTMPNGEVWVNCEETAHYIAGQFGREPDYGQSISVYDKRTGKVQRWLGKTVLPFTMVEDDHDRPLIALNGDTPEPEDVTLVDEFPPLPPPVKAPIAITFGPAPTGLTMWMGFTQADGYVPYGNCAWSVATEPDSRPVIEGATFQSDPRWNIGSRPLLHGYWESTQDVSPLTVDPEIDFAKRKGAKAVFLLLDDVNREAQRQNLEAAAERVKAAGLVPIYGAHAVERDDDYEESSLWCMEHESVGLVINARTVNKDPERMAETIRGVMADIQAGLYEVVWVFGSFAQLEQDWPDLARLLRETAINCQTPARFPGVLEPPEPPARPTPVVKPRETPRDPARGWAALLRALARLLGRV